MASPIDHAELAETVDLVMLMARRERIAELCRDISLARDMDGAIDVCARSLLRIFLAAQRVSVALCDDDRLHCRIHGAAGDVTTVGVGTRLPLHGTSVGEAVRTGEQVVVRSSDAGPFTTEIEALWRTGFRAVAITPLVAGDRAFGTIDLVSRDPLSFYPEERTMLWQVAAIVAANLDRHVLLASLRTALAASRGREQELQALRIRQQEIIHRQEAYLEETAAPTIPIAEQVIVIPVIGTLDEERARHLLEVAVQGADEHRARVVLVDLTGLRRTEPGTVQQLVAVAARVVFTGMTAAVAMTLVDRGADVSGLVTGASLRSAVAEALVRPAAR